MTLSGFGAVQTQNEAECTQIVATESLKMLMLNQRLKVGTLKISFSFYAEVLGMNLLRRKDHPSGVSSQAFGVDGDETNTNVLEFTHNWDQNHGEQADGYAHMELWVDDLRSTCSAIARRGGRLLHERVPMKHRSTLIAFAEDPDDDKQKFELIQLPVRELAS